MMGIKRIIGLVKYAKYLAYLTFMQRKLSTIRKQDKIRVVFVLHELASWKTELLYRKMLKHKRFDPLLVLTLPLDGLPSDCIRRYEGLKKYVNQQGYTYTETMFSDTFTKPYRPDFILYQKPYYEIVSNSIFFNRNLKSLFLYIQYSINSCNERWAFYQDAQRYSLFFFVENNIVAQCIKKLSKKDRNNTVITGVPYMDELMLSKENYKDPWKRQDGKKKRIIYAPHHSIRVPEMEENAIEFSSFLEIADIMLELAEKYTEKVQFAFKPHPLLRYKVELTWGKERTDAYYKKWEEMENTQLEEGMYMGLFKYSDAMIHDSCSFTTEYLYTRNPVMYLVNGKPHTEKLNQFVCMAYEQHYMGHTKAEIEQFIENVIHGIDPMKESRRRFYEDCLLPPHGKSACENIINAILGEEEYKD